MKDYSHYKKHIEIDMQSYSGNFHFNEQLKQEGINIKINEQSTQLIDGLETQIRAIVRNHGNEYNESKEERSIMIDKKYDYKAGDYVEYLGDMYLTNNSIDKDNPFFNTAKMTRCNYILKWTDDGVLYEQPCIVVNNTKYTGGIKTQGEFTEVSAMVNIIIQANDNTRKISYGKRLYTMKNAWQVTLIDNITTENILSWTLGKDSLNSEIDDVKNGICDAFVHNYAISLNSTLESIMETSTFQIIPIVTDNNTVVSNPTITYTSSDTSIANVDSSGLITTISTGTTTITATIGNISATLELTVTAKSVDPVISYSYNWSNGTTLKTYVSSTFSANKTTDSVNIPLLVAYNLDSTGTTLLNAGNISITKKSDYSYQIKNVNVSSIKSFTIQFIDNADNSVITTQMINLSGM